MLDLPKVGFVILNYNTYSLTLNLIKNIRDKLSYPNYEIIVVDNCSTNASQEILQSESVKQGFTFIANKINAGYAQGNNLGIAYAIDSGIKYIAISNNDIIIVEPDCVNKLIDALNSDGNIGVVSPCLISLDGKVDPPLYFKRPSFYDLTFGSFFYHRQRFKQDYTASYAVYAPRGSFMVLRSSDLKEINNLDENTFLYFEEPILAERLAKIGKYTWYCGNTKVIHNHGKTISTSVSRKRNMLLLVRSYRYYLKNYRNFNFWEIETCVLFRKIIFLIKRIIFNLYRSGN